MGKKISFVLGLLLAIATIFITPVYGSTRGLVVSSSDGRKIHFYDDYHALVIGVSNYRHWPKLPYAVDDAREVADKLKNLGFETRLCLDPTYREMKAALTDMVYNTGSEPDRALLLYYAGHGETESLADNTKMGYIIPSDCPLIRTNPLEFSNRAISMREIESVSLKIRSRHVLMLFDSCFSGSIFALVRAVPDHISEKSTLPVRQYITAGRSDEVVPDRSMFKRCLLIGLEGDADFTGDGYITGTELGMYLSDKVVNYTKRRQHPQYGKINNPQLDRGDFIFIPRKPVPDDVAVSRPGKDEQNRNVALEMEKLRRENEELKKMKDLIDENRRLKEGLGAIEQQKETKEASVSRHNDSTRFKAAIFPFYLIEFDSQFHSEVVGNIFETLEKQMDIETLFSCYRIKTDKKYVKDIKGSIERKEIWKEGFFSEPEPILETITIKGNNIGADLVITYYLEGVNEGGLSAYLIDVKKSRMYCVKGSYMGRDVRTVETEMLNNQLVEEFLKNRQAP